MGSSFKLWKKRLENQEILTKGQITQFCNAISAGARGYMIGGARTNLTPEECVILEEIFDSKPRGYGLTPEHTRFGIQWLRADQKRAEDLGITERILDTFLEFRFVDTRQIGANFYHTRANIVPVYRVISDAPPVDYYWSPWQLGAYA